MTIQEQIANGTNRRTTQVESRATAGGSHSRRYSIDTPLYPYGGNARTKP